VAIGPDASAFLDYWSGHLHLDCVFEPQHNAWGDQRWLDPVPVMFPTDIVHDVGVQVADWNLHARDLTADHQVDGRALRTFHFRGFDPARPYLLDAEMGANPRILLSEHPALAALVAERAAALQLAGVNESQTSEYGWSRLDDGAAIDDRMRRVYRMALKRGERPPPGFGPGTTDALYEWLAATDTYSDATRPSRYLMQVWFERVDLHAAFPDPTGEHTEAFLRWAREYGEHEAAIPRPLVPPAPPVTPPAAEIRHDGVNLAGYVRAVLGLGEAARLLLLGLDAASIPHAILSASGTQNEQSIDVEVIAASRAPFDITVACITADQLPVFAREVGPALLDGRHLAGFWFWENQQITDAMREGLELVDEIWVASEFCADVFRAYTDKPVVLIPLPVVAPSSGPTPAELGLPSDRFVFLNSFDYLSTFDRKNPLGVVQAFVAAFGPDDGPVLVMKSINGDKRVPQREELHLAAREHPHVMLIDGYVTPHEQNGYLLAADCFVSLHRAEGFGLGLAQCMALGKPAIATAYSGNLTFMSEANSWLVPYTMTTVGPDALPYPAGAPWAEPDLDAASEAMREVVAHADDRTTRGERARLDLAEGNTASVSGTAMRARMEQIRAARAPDPEPGPDPAPARGPRNRFRRR
jgi:glycosyltransferase involved in cell wall biosynthesis